MKIKYVIENDMAVVPYKASQGAGGWDVTATEIITNEEEPDYICVKTGLKLQPEANYKITLVARSSITKSRWIIQNSPVLCDEDYTGEYEIRYRAFPDGVEQRGTAFALVYPEFPFEVGDRVAQLYAEEVIPLTFKQVKNLDKTTRGSGGFGSTGKKIADQLAKIEKQEEEK